VSAASAPWLRPLGVGERVDAAIKLYLRTFRRLAPALVVVAVPIALLQGWLGWWRTDAFPDARRPFMTRDVFGVSHFHGDVLRAQFLSTLVAVLATLLLDAAPRAIAYRSYADAYLGRPGSWKDALTGGLRRLGSVYWVVLLIDGAVAVCVVGFLALTAALLGPLGPGATVLLIAPGILVVVFAVWWSVACRVAVPAVMMEDLRGARAVRRSLALVSGAWWPTFGTLLLADLLVGILTLVVNAILGALVDVLVPASHLASHVFVLTSLEQVLSAVAVVPFACAIATVVSVDLRVRKEGLDLELLTGAAHGPPATLGFLPRPRAELAPDVAASPWPPPPPVSGVAGEADPSKDPRGGT
jgi:hypothetical protein